MAQIEVLAGPERRRRWSEEQKRSLVAAAFMPGAVVREVARDADVTPSLIYRWRREFRAAAGSGFARVVVAPGSERAVAPPEPAIELELSEGTRVRIPATIPPALAAGVVGALVRR